MPFSLDLVFGTFFLACWCFADSFAVGAMQSTDMDSSPILKTTPEKPELPKTPNCFIFTHLQKSGGMTVRHVLEDWSEYPYVVYGSHQWIRGEKWRDSFVKNVTSSEETVIAGDTSEALRFVPAISEHCRWFILFRHPISRVVSVFFYCHLHPGDPLCGSTTMPVEAHADVVAFAKHWGNYALRQFVFGMVPAGELYDYAKPLPVANFSKSSKRGRLGRHDIAPWYLLKMYLDAKSGDDVDAPEPDEAMYDVLQPAKDTLGQRYAAVGILEKFDVTLDLFDAAFDVPGVGWKEAFATSGVHNNDGKFKREEDKVLEEAWNNTELKRYIHLDIQLYEHAVDVFHKQAQEYGVL